MLAKIHSEIHIQSFKHDQTLHRTWSKALVMEASEGRTIAITDRAYVVESDGRKWLTREPAICFFYPDLWFNVICMIRKKGIFYYCNLASPSIYDGEALKNIDYDLDIKVDQDYNYEMLDEDEYDVHKKQMNYSPKLQQAIAIGVEDLIERIQHKQSPFDHKEILKIYEDYLNVKEGIK